MCRSRDWVHIGGAGSIANSFGFLHDFETLCAARSQPVSVCADAHAVRIPRKRSRRRNSTARRPARIADRYRTDRSIADTASTTLDQGGFMRSILLWMLGVPIPIIILIALFWH
ncbi:hypothetical protein DIE14_25455 [Burkholderia sp. Bp9017]|nr:hypothetical protein DIE14_25455 [Burkholderia sp. Bp9017]RQZ31125.1 hypothetical protein DIE13_24020 [Burkholderia sp. Bp9016]